MNNFSKQIATSLNLNEKNVLNAIDLMFNQDCTIPFVARYRKEATGLMNEVILQDIRDLYTHLLDIDNTRKRYLKVVEEYAKNKPEFAKELPALLEKFHACTSKQELDDLYLPFKPKRQTKAEKARQMGLALLLDQILSSETITSLEDIAQPFVTQNKEQIDPQLHVNSIEDALNGAGYILSEKVAETSEIRSIVRKISFDTAFLCSEPSSIQDSDEKKKNLAEKYENYFEYREHISKAASHRVMAIRRGEAEKILKVSIDVDKDAILDDISIAFFSEHSTQCSNKRSWIESKIKDAYQRHIAPSIETEIRLHLKNKAESDAISVFAKNLQNLLLLPIIPEKKVLGIDPGIRTGSKIAVISETGNLLAYTTIYPNTQNKDSEKSQEASNTLANLISRYNISYISIGNGTGGRSIDNFVSELLEELNLSHKIKKVMVNEAGASIYSTSELAREEFPDLDPTIRSAVSIARRLQDPLAELVKIEPRSIGVGQYQHDCNVNKMNLSLKDTVEYCVNKVGVNINTASFKLLSYVSGIGSSLSQKIVQHRNNNGPFLSREDFLKVQSFGEKTFQQAAGFLRIPGSKNLLDNTAIHPERYKLVEKIATDLQSSINDFISDKTKLRSVSWKNYANDEVGIPTLRDISKELEKPGRDPRKDGSKISFTNSVKNFSQIKLGMKLKGTVSNVTNFGAFVDIGIHQDALVHISELTDEFIKNPSEVVAVGDVLDFRVIAIDPHKKHINLSCRKQSTPNTDISYDKNKKHNVTHKAKTQNFSPRNQFHPKRPNIKNNRFETSKNFSVGDLVSKFNLRQ